MHQIIQPSREEQQLINKLRELTTMYQKAAYSQTDSQVNDAVKRMANFLNMRAIQKGMPIASLVSAVDFFLNQTSETAPVVREIWAKALYFHRGLKKEIIEPEKDFSEAEYKAIGYDKKLLYALKERGINRMKSIEQDAVYLKGKDLSHLQEVLTYWGIDIDATPF